MGHLQKVSVAKWEDLVSMPHGGGILKVFSKALGCRDLAFSIARFPPGTGVDKHTHEVTEEVYVNLKGKAQIIIDGEAIDVAEMTAFNIPPEIERSTLNTGDEDNWWMFIGAPPQEYWILHRDFYKP